MHAHTGSAGASEDRIILHKNVLMKSPNQGVKEVKNESMVDVCLANKDQPALVTTTIAPRASLGGTPGGGTKDPKPNDTGVTADGGTPRYMTNSPRFNSLAVPASPTQKPIKEKEQSHGTRIVAPSPRRPLASGDGWSVTYEGRDGTPLNTNRNDASVIRSPRAKCECVCMCMYIYLYIYIYIYG
jgi:hypothetical protein